MGETFLYVKYCVLWLVIKAWGANITFHIVPSFTSYAWILLRAGFYILRKGAFFM